MKRSHLVLLSGFTINIVLISLVAKTWWMGSLLGAILSMPYVYLALNMPGKEGHESDQYTLTAQLPAFLIALLPLWEKHIALARSQSDAAMNDLTSQFSHIKSQLRDAVKLSSGSDEDGLSSMIEHAQTDLPASNQFAGSGQ